MFKKLKDAAKELVGELDKGFKELAGEVSGKPSVQPDETDTLPVKCTIKVHSERYKRLAMNKRVEVSSKKEYEKMKSSILDEFRVKYGSFTTTSGKSIDVWSNKAYKEVSKTLRFDDKNLVEALKKHGKW
ncbi:MAG: hypothetical protein EAX90_13840 [Candidatus Heimdallarchaeota archaeon]|nr:hypothetical protein [Candidatus Heimdallarchaeota archaeon]